MTARISAAGPRLGIGRTVAGATLEAGATSEAGATEAGGTA